MFTTAVDAGDVLDTVKRVKARTRFFRGGHWFAAVVFGVVILGALPFYVRSTPAHTSRCRTSGHDAFVCTYGVTNSPIGRAFSPWFRNPLSSWATLYWTIAVVVGFAVVAFYYHRRAQKTGVGGHLWPSIAVGLTFLGFMLWFNYGFDAPAPDFWIRGTSAVVVIAFGLVALSILDRSIPFASFATGFVGLAFLTSLYTVINIFQRLGIAAPFRGTASDLPNLILPGAYLLIGGLCFLVGRGWTARVRLLRVTE
ncbi:MAG: hypothetical protein ACRDWE_07015 [Acidimicrobiales bacterium]